MVERRCGRGAAGLAHIIGVSVSETTAEATTAMVSVSANSRNMRPTSPVMNSSGMNTAISDSVSEITVKPISRAPRNAASIGVFAVLHMANDVLDHDDGVVDDEAGADGQRHQRQIVEREAAEPHHAEGRDQRQRQCDAGDDGGADGAQEDQHDQHDQHDAEHQRELHVVDRGADGVGAVIDDGELSAGRHRAPQPRQFGPHALHGLDHIGAGLALHVDDDRGLALIPGADFGVLQAFDDVGDVAEQHRRAVADRPRLTDA